MKQQQVILLLACFTATFWVTSSLFSEVVEVGHPPFTDSPRFTGHRISCSDFDISPSGRQIIFLVSFSGRFNELWMANIDGTGSKMLYRIEEVEHDPVNHQFIYTPRYSPDGKNIVFMKSSKDSVALCILDLGKGSVRDVASLSRVNYVAGWTDNQSVYYQGWEGNQNDGYVRTLYQIGVDGTGQTNLISGIFDNAYPCPACSKVCLVYKHRTDSELPGKYYTVELYDLRSGKKTEIIQHERRFTGHHPVWLPNENGLIFQTDSGAVSVSLGGEVKLLIPDGFVWACSTNGRSVFTQGSSVYVEDPQ